MEPARHNIAATAIPMRILFIPSSLGLPYLAQSALGQARSVPNFSRDPRRKLFFQGADVADQILYLIWCQ
jgi:hypothetical protein